MEWSSCVIAFLKTNNNHGSTALYGLRPPLSEVTWSCAFVAVSDQLTGYLGDTCFEIWTGHRLS
jgi:hypothetical protein